MRHWWTTDDPSEWIDKFPTKELQDKERQRLHDIIGKFENESSTSVRGLVSWDDIKIARVIEEAQKEIARSLAWNNGDEPPTKPEDVRKYLEAKAPKIYDPFCGGGSIPLEAQRLGLEAHGSDLNPVAVLITKALIEIPPKFKNLAPVIIGNRFGTDGNPLPITRYPLPIAPVGLAST